MLALPAQSALGHFLRPVDGLVARAETRTGQLTVRQCR